MSEEELIEQIDSQAWDVPNDPIGRVVHMDDVTAIIDRYFNGRPACPGKPVEDMSRDELVAYVREREYREIDDPRLRTIEEVATKYHEAIADFFSGHARDQERAGFPGFADEHRHIAARHQVYAREIREQVWLRSDGESHYTLTPKGE